MAGRHQILLRTLPLAALTLVLACSPTTRYRVLNFFFDGVPAPGERQEQAAAEATPSPAADQASAPEAPRTSAPLVYAHPPYRNNRCGTCHNSQDGQLFKSAREGLCMPCHGELTREPTYVHGPVALNECLFCHHHHASPHPKVLLYEATATCLRCHQRGDLTEGPHHQTIDQTSCVTCHDPHGGSNRFFVKDEQRPEP